MRALCVGVLGIACVALSGCARASRAQASEPPALDAGGDRPVDAGSPSDAAPSPDAEPKAVRVFVPFLDCAANEAAAGVAVEACKCATPTGAICCEGGTVFECTDYGWRSVHDSRCTPSRPRSAMPGNTEWDPSQASECHTCERGSAGCWCRDDGTCAEELLCVENLCGRRAD